MTLVDFHQSSLSMASSSAALRGRILGFCGQPLLIERLKEMGLHPGLEVSVVGRAPFGGPLLFRFGNTVLALRQEEAQCALIQSL